MDPAFEQRPAHDLPNFGEDDEDERHADDKSPFPTNASLIEDASIENGNVDSYIACQKGSCKQRKEQRTQYDTDQAPNDSRQKDRVIEVRSIPCLPSNQGEQGAVNCK